MSVLSREIAENLSSASWIRRMFEEADRLRAQVGAENVFDFSLGNPHLEPPSAVLDRLQELTARPVRGMHRYMANAGFAEVRAKVAASVSRQVGRTVPASHIVMTAGAACGLNVALRAMLEPGENVLILAPFFPEYGFYAANAGGVVRAVQTTEDFDLDVAAVADAIDDRTRALILNSPNNPTGRVYPERSMASLSAALAESSRRRPAPIVVVSDEPYRRLVYDGIPAPNVFEHYDQTIVVASFSKDLGLAGERIGYLAVHPEFRDAEQLLAGLTFCLRTLGFVNAPALVQLAVADCLDATVDVAAYQRNRDLLFAGLVEIGYSVIQPQGAFYLFPRSPIANDVEFVGRLAKRQVLAVPGRGFGRPGYFRLSYAVDEDVIHRALPRFAEALHEPPVHH